MVKLFRKGNICRASKPKKARVDKICLEHGSGSKKCRQAKTRYCD